MDMQLRNGKVLQPTLDSNAGLTNTMATSRETTGQPNEMKRPEPNRDVNQPAAGVGRPVARHRDRDAGGRTEPEMNQARAETGLAELLRQFATQLVLELGHAPQRVIGYEDGRNMRNFLDLAEIEFEERRLDPRLWGSEMKKYLTGDALVYWLYLRRT